MSGLLAMLLMIASQSTNYAASYGGFKMIIAVSWFLGKLIMFFAIAYFLTSRFLKLASKSGFQKRPRQMLIGYLLLVASLVCMGSDAFWKFCCCWRCLSGRRRCLECRTVEVKEKIAKGFGSGLASIPMGILFMVIGMEVNLKAAEGSIIFLAVLLVAVIGAKLIGCWIATNNGF